MNLVLNGGCLYNVLEGEIIQKIQRGQYEDHNTSLGYHTDQGPRVAVNMMVKECIVV